MSQAGIVDIEGAHPQIPTSFVTNDGTAIPIANVLEILGEVVDAYGVPLQTTGSGNTVTIVAQYASSSVSSLAANAGLSSFNSADFTVDANGFVSLASSPSGAILTINSEHPDSSGNFDITSVNLGITNSAHTVDIEDLRYTTQYVVDPSSTIGSKGTYTTISAALAAAGAAGGGTVFVRTGIYSENPSVPANVMLTSYDSPPFNTVGPTIQGTVTLNGLGSCGISNIMIAPPSSSSAIVSSGDNTTVIYINNCAVEAASGASSVSLSNANAIILFENCLFISSGGNYLTSSGVGGLGFNNCQFKVVGGTPAIALTDTSVDLQATYIDNATTMTATGSGEVNMTASSCGYIDVSGAVDFNGYNSTVGQFVITGSGTALFDHSSVLSDGTGLGVSVGILSTADFVFTTVQSGSSTYAIGGTGTINHGLINFTGSNGTIDPGLTIQYTIVRPYATTSIVGLASFNPSDFTVSSAGEVSALASGESITTIDGDSGSMTPTAGVVTISGGSTGLTTSASGSTMDLTGTLVVGNGGTGATTLTGLLLGHGTSAVTGVTPGDYGVLISSSAGVPSWLPNGTTGQILTATTSGTASWENPASSSVTFTGDSGTPFSGNAVTVTGASTGLTFAASTPDLTLGGTLHVAYGGTGDNSFTAYAPVCGGTTSTAALQSASTGISNAGYVLTSTGSSSLPTWQAVTGSSNVNFITYITNDVNTSNINATTPYSPIMDTIVSNVGGGYSTVTGLFTAPETGLYVFYAALNIESMNTQSSTPAFYLNYNGSSGTLYRFAEFNGTIASPESIYYNGNSGAIIQQMTEGDTMGLVITANPLTTTYISYTLRGSENDGFGNVYINYFQGYLVTSGEVTTTGVTTLDADSGSASGSSTLTVSGGSTGLTTTASAQTMDLTGTLNVGHGGTGATTLTGLLTGNGTSAVTATAITQYNVITGGSSNAPHSVAPSATSGVPLISQGSSSQPVFGTAVVAGGGTGATSFTAYAPVCGGTSTTAALASASSGISNSGYVLTSTGSSSLPTWQAAAGGGYVSMTPYIVGPTGDTHSDYSGVGGIASAIAAAVTAGASSSAPAVIMVKPGNGTAYTAPTMADGIWIVAFGAAQQNVEQYGETLLPAVQINGTITLGGSTSLECGIIGCYLTNSATTNLIDVTNTAVSRLYLGECYISSSAGSTINVASTANLGLFQLNDCTVLATNAILTDANVEGASLLLCDNCDLAGGANSTAVSGGQFYFYHCGFSGEGIDVSTGTAYIYNCYTNFVSSITCYNIYLYYSNIGSTLTATSLISANYCYLQYATLSAASYQFTNTQTAAGNRNTTQCAFNYTLGTTDSNQTGDGTVYTLGSGNALTMNFDQGSNFTTGGTFTAPAAGIYRLGCCISSTGTVAATDGILSVVCTGKTYQLARILPTDITDTIYHGDVLVNMASGDTATFTLKVSGTSKTVSITGSGSPFQTYVYGNLVC